MSTFVIVIARLGYFYNSSHFLINLKNHESRLVEKHPYKDILRFTLLVRKRTARNFLEFWSVGAKTSSSSISAGVKLTTIFHCLQSPPPSPTAESITEKSLLTEANSVP